MLARIDGLIIGRDLLRCMSPELALSGHALAILRCPLLRIKADMTIRSGPRRIRNRVRGIGRRRNHRDALRKKQRKGLGVRGSSSAAGPPS
jgi:hypothetical protein